MESQRTGALNTAWIHNALYDLFFFSSFWWIPFAAWLLMSIETTIEAALLFTLYHLLLRLPHFVATLRVTYLNPDHREYYRKHWIKFFLVPAAILLVYVTPIVAGTELALFRKILITIALGWGLHHVGAQNFGILNIYHLRTGSRRSLAQVRTEKLCFTFLGIATAIQIVATYWFEGASPFAQWLSHAMVVGFALTALPFLLSQVRNLFSARKDRQQHWPAMLYFLVSVACMIYWPFYDSLPYQQGPILHFYVYNGHHGLAYIGLTYFMERKRNNASSGNAFSFASILLLGSLALMTWVLGGVPRSAEGLIARSTFQSYDCLQGVFVVHYYLEAISWKFSDPHLRATVLPLLSRTVPRGVWATR